MTLGKTIEEPAKQGNYIDRVGKKVKGIVYWVIVLEVAYIPIVRLFGDQLNSERYINRISVGDSVIVLRKQDRPAYLWPVYQVTALNKKNEIVYDKAAGLERCAKSLVTEAKKILENL